MVRIIIDRVPAKTGKPRNRENEVIRMYYCNLNLMIIMEFITKLLPDSCIFTNIEIE